MIMGDKFALLEPGDMIEEGDEWYSPHADRWVQVDYNLDGTPVEPGGEVAGTGWNPYETKPIRRRLG